MIKKVFFRVKRRVAKRALSCRMAKILLAFPCACVTKIELKLRRE